MAEIYYVPEALFEILKQKVEKGEPVTEDDVGPLTSPMTAEDDAVMIPVDMRGMGKEYDDVDDVVLELGPKGAVEAFAKARHYFVANAGGDAEGDRAGPLTGRQLKDMMMQEEEDDEGEDEGEEGEAGAGGAPAGPAAKRARSG